MKNRRTILVILILFIAFSVIAFVIPTDLSYSFWVSYAFSIIAFCLYAFVWLDFFKEGRMKFSRFYKIPTLYVCSWYIGIQMIVSLVFKFLPNVPIWVSVIICVILLANTLIGVISVDGAAEYIEGVDARVKQKVNYIKSLQVDAELLYDSLKTKESKEAVRSLIDKLKYSDPMSDTSLVSIEEDIQKKIDELKSLDEIGIRERVPSILLLIEERNKKCKLLK